MSSVNKIKERLATVSISTKVLVSFLLLTVVFMATLTYSFLKHRKIASDLKLLNEGYLKISFAIVEMRTTQRVLTLELEKMLEEEDKPFVMSWIYSVRRIRPVILDNVGKKISHLLKTTGSSKEQEFLQKLQSDVKETRELFTEVEKSYEVLFSLLEEGGGGEVEDALKIVKDEENEIESNLRHLQTLSVHRINTIAARSQEVEKRTLWMLTELIFLTISFCILTAIAVHRLLSPLGELKKGVEILARGDLNYRIEIKKKDEIGSFAEQLNSMAQALQERDRRLRFTERLAAIGKMASHIAHEVKNPLSSIGLNTEMIMEEAEEVKPEDKREEIITLTKSISKEVDRVTSLLNYYLRLGKPPKPVFERSDICKLIREVKSFMDKEFEENKITVELELPEQPVEVEMDRNQIKQMLMNLLKNSIEAMEDRVEKNLRIKLAMDENDAKILISDTGKGIAEEDREKIFEPFFTDKEGGSGLGLPITRQIVIDHGGTIDCISEKGKGTSFEISLPMRRQNHPGEEQIRT